MEQDYFYVTDIDKKQELLGRWLDSYQIDDLRELQASIKEGEDLIVLLIDEIYKKEMKRIESDRLERMIADAEPTLGNYL